MYLHLLVSLELTNVLSFISEEFVAMPRGTKLTDNEMQIADQLRTAGLSNIKIAAQMNRSEKVIRTYLTSPDEYRRVKRAGRP